MRTSEPLQTKNENIWGNYTAILCQPDVTQQCERKLAVCCFENNGWFLVLNLSVSAYVAIACYWQEEFVNLKELYMTFSNTKIQHKQNKKAQLSLTNPRDACEKFARFT